MFNKEYGVILHELTRGLSGDQAQDIHGMEIALSEIKSYADKQELERALTLMEALASKCQRLAKEGLGKEETKVSYFCFEEPFEENLYAYLYHVQKEMQNPPLNFVEIYELFGDLLVNCGRYADAEKAYEEAILWNPVSVRLIFKKAKTYKSRGRFEEYWKEIINIFPVAFRAKDFAKAYCELGFCLMEKEDYDRARCFYLYSKEFAALHEADLRIQQIRAKLGTVKKPSASDLQQAIKGVSVPFGLPSNVLTLALAYQKHYYERRNEERVHYYYDILSEFTQNDSMEQMVKDTKYWKYGEKYQK